MNPAPKATAKDVLHQAVRTERLLTKHGAYDPRVSEIAHCAKFNKNLTNASRNLSKFIHRKGKTLPVPVTPIQTLLKARAFTRRKKLEVRPWPTLHLSSWLRVCLEHRVHRGFFMLGGFKTEQLREAEVMLQQFPRGLGKGFDAALMGKWLREVFAGLTPDMEAYGAAARLSKTQGRDMEIQLENPAVEEVLSPACV
ncbi:Uncharacterized protein SCF082_LOCUS21428 [Durusdinium trenchii]|uniref:Uncharacterized protein n=1 Tax=Durusdinium trenchii TaxID=1381693 RepID=A0ABP0LBU7_9DINO